MDYLLHNLNNNRNFKFVVVLSALISVSTMALAPAVSAVKPRISQAQNSPPANQPDASQNVPGTSLPARIPLQADPASGTSPATGPGTNSATSPASSPATNAGTSPATTGGANAAASAGPSTAELVNPVGKDAELRGMEVRVSLPRAFDEGLLRSPRTSAIRLLLGITKSEMVRATELPNPTIFMDNGYRAEFTYRYGLQVPIEPPWKLALRLVLAKNMIKQTDLEILKALWIFRAQVRRAYTDLVVAQELYATLTELVELTDQLQKIARKRFEAGEVAELDVYRAEQEAYKALAEQAQQQYRVLEARQALTVILGRVPAADIAVPRLPPEGPNPEANGILPGNNLPTLQACLDRAMANRPELKVLQQAIKTNGANLRLAFANVLPNPQIGVGTSSVNGPTQPSVFNLNDALASSLRSGTQFEPQAKDRVNFHGFFFQVFQEIPMFNVQQGDITKYRATDRQLKAELLGQQNLVTSEVATSYQRLSGAKRKIEIYQSNLLQRTLEIARLARLSYEVGQSDINATLLAQQATITIKTEYLASIQTFQQAYTDLEQSIGNVLQ